MAVLFVVSSALLVSFVRGLSPQDVHIVAKVDDSMNCTLPARKAAARFAKKGMLSALENHPCIEPEELTQMRRGSEDPADAFEFLGHAGVVEPTLLFSKNPYTKVKMRNRRNDSCKKRMLPSVLYIGMGHSGSTTLAEMMNAHPNMSYGDMKEHRFFANRWPREAHNWNQYANQFWVPCEVMTTFEATPTYMKLGDASRRMTGHPHFLWHPPGVDALRALKKALPGLRLIAMFRDPVTYLNSHKNLSSLNEAKWLINSSQGCYVNELEPWYEVFDKEDFLFLRAEDFFRDPQYALDKIFRFVGLPEYRLTKSELAPEGRRRAYKDPMILSTQFRRAFHGNTGQSSCKKRLEEFTGLHFDWEGAPDAESEFSAGVIGGAQNLGDDASTTASLELPVH